MWASLCSFRIPNDRVFMKTDHIVFEDSQHFWWGQTNYLPHHKQLTAGVCIDKNLRQEGDYESISQSDE